METRLRQVVEAFQRVRAFLDEHPATGTMSYARRSSRSRTWGCRRGCGCRRSR